MLVEVEWLNTWTNFQAIIFQKFASEENRDLIINRKKKREKKKNDSTELSGISGKACSDRLPIKLDTS